MVKGEEGQSWLRRTLSSRARTLVLFISFLGLLFQAPASAQSAELLFTYWGSPQEKAAVESMVADFMAQHPDIRVRAQHIPNTSYAEKMSTMLASGDPPDVAYLFETQALPWAQEGRLMDLSAYFQSDPEASSRLENTYYNYGDGKTLGTNTAGETMVMYYNKALFDEVGLEYPPSRAEEAWTWDEFVEVAKKLTKDGNGNDATSPDFDPNNIQTYGISFAQWWGGYLPFVLSNGGGLANEEGTEFTLDQPEAVEALQKMQDLIYVHHVAPTPTQAAAFPSADIMMQTGKVAMTIDGHWKVLDFSQLPGLNWSVGVLPYFKEPVTVMLGAPTVIFASTEYPDAAFEFYKFHNNPEYVDLFRKGLWMPLQKEYYTDEAKMNAWLNGQEGVYPPEAKDVFVDYTLNHTPYQPPTYWLKNYAQIESEAINPAMELLWSGKATAQEAMNQAAERAAPLMEGRW
jgi:multiple sugar transport system substrate-binding protein